MNIYHCSKCKGIWRSKDAFDNHIAKKECSPQNSTINVEWETKEDKTWGKITDKVTILYNVDFCYADITVRGIRKTASGKDSVNATMKAMDLIMKELK